mgnify:CR=1 FL=1
MVSHKDTGNKWIWEVINWHCMIVKLQSIIDIELILFDFIGSPFLFSKGSQFENSVIEINDGEELASVVLLDISELDITFWTTSEHLLHVDYEGL